MSSRIRGRGTSPSNYRPHVQGTPRYGISSISHRSLLSLIKRKYWPTFLALALASLFFLFYRTISHPLASGSQYLVGQLSNNRVVSSVYGGILTVPPQQQRHPILDLLERGEREAKRLEQVRESVKSLEDAVQDYKLAFDMDPPEGFPQWYELAIKLNSTTAPSLLPLAHTTVLPFLSLPPALLRKRVKDIISTPSMAGFHITPESETQKVKMGPMNPTAARRLTPRQWQWMLSQDVARMPHSQDPDEPVLMAFWTDDSTFRMVDGGLRDESIQLARKGATWDKTELEKRETETKQKLGWLHTCPSASWASFAGMSPPPQPTGKRFIVDPKEAADYCLHPELLEQNGELIMRNDYPMRPLVPVLAITRPLHGTDMIGPTPQSHEHILKDPLPWSSKNDSRLLWRGEPSGIYHIDRFPWRKNQRDRLAFYTGSRRNDTVDLLLDDGASGQTFFEARNASELVKKYTDAGVIHRGLAWHCGWGGAHEIYCHDEERVFRNCPRNDQACVDMKTELQFKNSITPEDAQRYKFILDIDGYGWSSRFRKELSTGSVVVKTTIYNEWWSAQAVPWYHYIPSLYDFSDLFDIVAFFNTPSEDGSNDRDKLAEAIGTRGREFALSRMSWDDMRSYIYLLVLEYRRAWSDDRLAASYRPA